MTTGYTKTATLIELRLLAGNLIRIAFAGRLAKDQEGTRMTGLPNRGFVHEVDVRDLCTSSSASSVSVSATSTSVRGAPRQAPRVSREYQIHEAVLLSFSDTVPDRIELLTRLSLREWRKLLYWLDVSGLALYLLDRFVQLGLSDVLPRSIVDNLQQKMTDNTQRTCGMADESVAIQLEFQKAGLCYAVMKGVSLSPSSVPRPELRHQFDLDYFIAEMSAREARLILERRGYRLYAISGKTWEFKINETPTISMKDLYRDLPYRSVELHLDADTADHGSRLERIQYRKMHGIAMPMFSPVDIFLGQAMHAFKDICSEFSRTAHLLEVYRHVLTRRDEKVFWRELRVRGEGDRKTCLGIGVVIYLIASIMGNFAPEALTLWTVDVLPSSARLWVDLYGRRTALGKHPGTKLYLLLQKELESAGVSGKRPAKKSLWPSRLPPAVIQGAPDEALSTRLARYRVQGRFIFSRLRFHIVEGFRYRLESYRWRRHLDRISS
jgi:hypothetical protein